MEIFASFVLVVCFFGLIWGIIDDFIDFLREEDE